MVTIQGKPKLNLDYKGLDQRWVKYYEKITPRVQLCCNSFCIFLVLWDDSDEVFMPVFIWWMLAQGISQMSLVGGKILFCVPQCSKLPAGGCPEEMPGSACWECSSILAGTGLGDTTELLSSKPECFLPLFNKIKHQIKKKKVNFWLSVQALTT